MTLPTFEAIATALSNGQRVFIECRDLPWPLKHREIIGFQEPDKILVRGWTDEWMAYPPAGRHAFFSIIGTETETEPETRRRHFKMDDWR